MDYQKIYGALVERARNRTLAGIYTERHHVIPRCMGGSDDRSNLVDLTAEEHYVAHQLLVKIFPHKYGLVVATLMMSKNVTGNKAYGWLMRRIDAARKDPQVRMMMSEITKKLWLNPEWKENQRAARRGKKQSIECRQKRSESTKGERAHWYGKKFSEEHRQRLVESFVGRHAGENHPMARAVICNFADGQEILFPTGKDAIQWLRDNGHPKASKSAIVYACSAVGRSAYKCKWRYADQPRDPEICLEFE